MHGNECFIQKVKKIAWTEMKESLSYLFCRIVYWIQDTRLCTGPRALLQYAIELVNLLDIAARRPWVRFMLAEKIICDVEK